MHSSALGVLHAVLRVLELIKGLKLQTCTVQVYPDMQEIEMGDPVREQLGRESPTKPFSVNLKSGRNLQLP